MYIDSTNRGLNLRFVEKYEICEINSYKICLFLSVEDNDFHFYRQNRDGSWSHKLGNTNVTNLDASNNLIYDPNLCDRNYLNKSGSNYNYFVGYFSIRPLNIFWGNEL